MFLEGLNVKSLLFLWLFPLFGGGGRALVYGHPRLPFPLYQQAEMVAEGCCVESGRAVGPGRMPSLSLLWYFLPFGGVVSDYLDGKGLYFRQLTPCLLPKTLLLFKTEPSEDQTELLRAL